jgi:two-component system nitrogen regulation sensor histidine kinase NtrY
VVEDVTDVSHAQRLEAWAAMARIIAHEIKNPLTPIRLSAEHLREAWARDREHFEAVFERCTSNILAQVEELRRTASEFSLYAEIPRSEKRSGELGEIVAEVVDGYRTAPPPGVTIRYQGPSRPLAAELDRRLVGRAVRNLIENALRAQATGGEIEIEVGGEDGTGFVRVADRGPGVAPELLGRILEPYFSTQAGGTGLGLPIARRVAAEHGGELTVRNRAGGGFEVTMTIPLR